MFLAAAPAGGVAGTTARNIFRLARRSSRERRIREPGLRDPGSNLGRVELFEVQMALGSVSHDAASASLDDASAFPLRSSTPHTVWNAFVDRILETLRLHRAATANFLRCNNADTVARKERFRRQLDALAYGHPVRVCIHTSEFQPLL